MKTQQPITAQDEHRVLKFRPRSSVHPPGRRGESSGNLGKSGKQAQPEDDLARYERDQDEPDDFRLRMLANVAAFAFTVALTAIGISDRHSAPPLNSARRSDIRAPRLRMADRAFRGLAPASRAISEFTFNISKV